jgi:hypothetical protein
VYHACLYLHAVVRTEEIFTEEMRQLGEDAKTKVHTEVRVKNHHYPCNHRLQLVWKQQV